MNDDMPWALIVIGGIILFAISIAIYFGVADGTVACMFAEDPFLCSAVDRNK